MTTIPLIWSLTRVLRMLCYVVSKGRAGKRRGEERRGRERGRKGWIGEERGDHGD